MMPPDSKVLDLAKQVGRLTPDWRDPERYFQNRSEIEHKLRRLAHELREASRV